MGLGLNKDLLTDIGFVWRMFSFKEDVYGLRTLSRELQMSLHIKTVMYEKISV